MYGASGISLELTKYFSHDILNILNEEERIKFDILRLWRTNNCQYSIISIITCYLLAPLVSTIESKSAFITCCMIMFDNISRLKRKYTIEFNGFKGLRC